MFPSPCPGIYALANTFVISFGYAGRGWLSIGHHVAEGQDWAQAIGSLNGLFDHLQALIFPSSLAVGFRLQRSEQCRLKGTASTSSSIWECTAVKHPVHLTSLNQQASQYCEPHECRNKSLVVFWCESFLIADIKCENFRDQNLIYRLSVCLNEALLAYDAAHLLHFVAVLRQLNLFVKTKPVIVLTRLRADRSKSDRWPKTSNVTMSHLLKGQLFGPKRATWRCHIY